MLKVQNLKKSFVNPEGQSETVIDIEEMSLEACSQTAMYGPSGCGKSTLINLISGLLTPDSGAIEFQGSDITSLDEAKRDSFRAAHLGIVFQSFYLLEGYTALENVEMAMLLNDKLVAGRAKELLVSLGLEDRIHYYPSQLSVGQQQRVAVARALANKPLLLLADEPTASLDAEFAKQAIDLISQNCKEQEVALLLVSHDQAVLSQFDKQLSLPELNLAYKRKT